MYVLPRGSDAVKKCRMMRLGSMLNLVVISASEVGRAAFGY